jgi:RimJ/RimL family protein N-acetyltransferase
MEKRPDRQERDDAQVLQPSFVKGDRSDWRQKLPMLSGQQVVLREPRLSDATSLFALLTTRDVGRFISSPPSTVGGFERFIAWTFKQRTAGTSACFAVTLKDFNTAIGIFQVREAEPRFATAEWGFAIGSPFWGTGVFAEAAQLVLEFAFETLGVHRLEARAAVRNGRGTGALLKIGAVPEGVLRKSLLRDGEYLDQVMYAIVEDDWRASHDASSQTSGDRWEQTPVFPTMH